MSEIQPIAFPLAVDSTIELGPFEYADKVPLKKNFKAAGPLFEQSLVGRLHEFVQPLGAVLGKDPQLCRTMGLAGHEPQRHAQPSP